MSQDSGLAVYKDIDKVPAWKKKGLSYHDLCDPAWLANDPEVFYGFWGSCFNSYMDTSPHEGYAILRRWAREQFGAHTSDDDGSSDVAPYESTSESETESDDSESGSGNDSESESDDDDENGNINRRQQRPRSKKNSNVLIYTSNVDTAFARAGFSADKVPIFEVHGNITTWQCSKGGRCNGGTQSGETWQLARDLRFAVDKKTMRCRSSPQQRHLSRGDSSNEIVSVVCRHCRSERARPNILMFDDGGWVGNPKGKWRYKRWLRRQKRRLKEDCTRKLVILEIGCGKRIPTVRQADENLVKSLRMGQARLIRINPDFERADSSNAAVSTSIISIKDSGLAALQKIDAAMVALNSGNG